MKRKEHWELKRKQLAQWAYLTVRRWFAHSLHTQCTVKKNDVRVENEVGTKNSTLLLEAMESGR